MSIPARGARALAFTLLLALSAPALAQLLPGLSKPGPSESQRAEAEREHAAQVKSGEEVKPSAEPSASAVAPGGEFAIAVVMDHATGWHTWPSAAQDVLPPDIAEFAIRTTINLDEVPDWVAAVGPVQWPDPIEGVGPDPTTGNPIKLQLYQKRAVAFIPVRIAPDAAPGPRTLTVALSYQACNDTMCVMPEDRSLTVSFTIDPKAPTAFASTNSDFDTFGSGVFADASKWPATSTTPAPAGGSTSVPPAPNPAEQKWFGIPLSAFTGPLGLALLVLCAALGGAVLNLTPCVLPVIPIKIMTLTRHADAAEGGKHSTLYLGFWMAMGVVAFWFALALPVVLINFGDPSRLFGIWYVTLAIGLLIAIMSLGLMGMFSLSLPQQVYMVNPNADSAPGSFLFGAMTAVLGLPCFGFAAGPLLAVAAKVNSPLFTIAVFTAIGVGMAAPYFILSAKPSLVKAVPKAGPAGDLVKQVMGLLLLAAGVYFIGTGLIALVAEQPWIAKNLHWWAVAVFATLAGVWLFLRTIQISKRPLPIALAGAIGFVLAGVALVTASSLTRDAKDNYLAQQSTHQADDTLIPGTWQHYTPARFAAARADPKNIVVLDFTAEWCINCKALKAAILDADPVKSLLARPDAVLLEVDLTSRKDPGWEMLKSLGKTGIPMLAIYGPGISGDTPWMSNAYTPGLVVEAINAARGSESLTQRP